VSTTPKINNLKAALLRATDDIGDDDDIGILVQAISKA
jgi:hypothetical protein